VTVLHEAPLATMLEQDVLLAAEEDALPLDGEKELESIAEASMVSPARRCRRTGWSRW
jgi:hypothetical protein